MSRESRPVYLPILRTPRFGWYPPRSEGAPAGRCGPLLPPRATADSLEAPPSCPRRPEPAETGPFDRGPTLQKGRWVGLGLRLRRVVISTTRLACHRPIGLLDLRNRPIGLHDLRSPLLRCSRRSVPARRGEWPADRPILAQDEPERPEGAATGPRRSGPSPFDSRARAPLAWAVLHGEAP